MKMPEHFEDVDEENAVEESSEDLDLDYGDEQVRVNGSEEYAYVMKIPKDRIAVLIGVKGAGKKELEEYSYSKISIDSKEGDVTISGKDAIKLYELREVVKAIGRGFSPETARLLLKPDYMLEVISLKDYGVDNKNKLIRVRSRIIGTGGKARRTLETLTRTNLSIYGKTISVLGEANDVANAKRAIDMLITGSMHSGVYKWLEGQRRKERMDRGAARDF
jgi:ribosomal RNA assembly protein